MQNLRKEMSKINVDIYCNLNSIELLGYAKNNIVEVQELANNLPDEFRKNQQAILEQFVAHKIK